MTAGRYVLAIDQGTTRTRAMLFDAEGRPRGMAQKELAQLYPEPGWVEHDPEEIWAATLEVCRQALAAGKVGVDEVAAIGIANQRETAILWERQSGRPLHNAIVWQDRRTVEACRRLSEDGFGGTVAAKTGSRTGIGAPSPEVGVGEGRASRHPPAAAEGQDDDARFV